MGRPLVVAVVGDERVGKSTLVLAQSPLASLSDVAPVVPDVVRSAGPLGGALVFRDSAAIAEADVVVVVWALDRPETRQRVSSVWLPAVEAAGKPVVVVANKLDRASGDDQLQFAGDLLQGAAVEAHACAAASSMRLNTDQVALLALRCARFPRAPLLGSGSGRLTPAYERALTCLFRRFDADGDGALSDAELGAFQRAAYGADAAPADLRVVRTVLAGGANDDGGGDGDDDPGALDLRGFLEVHRYLLRRGRTEDCWQALARLGFDKDLSLEELAQGRLRPLPRLRPGQQLLLRPPVERFLRDLFAVLAGGADELLPQPEAARAVAAASPEGAVPWQPWHVPLTSTAAHATAPVRDGVTVDGWLALFELALWRDPDATRALLLQLGAAPGERLVEASRVRRRERRRRWPRRDTHRVHVSGLAREGLRVMLGRDDAAADDDVAAAAAGGRRFVLSTAAPAAADDFDAHVVVVSSSDGSGSGSGSAGEEEFLDGVPLLFGFLGEFAPPALVEKCAELRIPPPVPADELLVALALAVAEPARSTPLTPAKLDRKRRRATRRTVLVGLGVVCGLAGVVVAGSPERREVVGGWVGRGVAWGRAQVGR